MAKGTDIYIISGTGKARVSGGPYIPADLSADSVPDFDNWGWDSYWSCNAFLQWYKLMKAKYGLDYAKAHFLTAWETAWTFGSYHQSCCQQSDFRNYFKAEGIDVDTLTCSLTMPVVDATGEVVEDTASAASSVSSIGKYAIPVLTLAAFVGLGIWGYNSYLSPEARRK